MFRHVVSLISALAVTDVECRRVIFDNQATINGLVSLLDVAYEGDSLAVVWTDCVCKQLIDVITVVVASYV